MGIHGEPGKYKCKWMNNKQMMATLLSLLKEQYQNGDIILMINNLGGVTNLEMTLIVHDIL